MGFLTLKAADTDPTIAAMEAQGYLIEVMHIASGKTCSFPSWLTEYSDNFTSEWKSERIFGRNDPIGSFMGVSRKINLALEVPSFSVEEARENLHQLEHLYANLYPSYRKRADVQVMEAYPLVKVRFSNLIKSYKSAAQKAGASPKLGLAGWIDNVTFSPDLEAGFHHPPAGGEYLIGNGLTQDQVKANDERARMLRSYNGNESNMFYPKILKFSFSLSVVHEHQLGWNDKSWLGDNGQFTYTDITLSGNQHDQDDSPAARGFSRGLNQDAIKKEIKKRYSNILNGGV